MNIVPYNDIMETLIHKFFNHFKEVVIKRNAKFRLKKYFSKIYISPQKYKYFFRIIKAIG